MQKLFLMPLYLVLTAVSANAQYVWIIPKAGISLSSQSFKTPSGSNPVSKYLANPVFGVALEYGLSNENRFSIQPELYYFTKGSVQNQDTAYKTFDGSYAETNKFTFKYNALELPILFKFSIGDVDEHRLSFLTGPSFSYLLGGKYEEVFHSVDISSDYPKGYVTDTTYNSKITFGSVNISRTSPYSPGKIDANRFSIGWQFGIAGNIKFGPGSVMADLRYSTQISNFNKKDGFNYTNVGAAKINYFMISFGYMIPLDGK